MLNSTAMFLETGCSRTKAPATVSRHACIAMPTNERTTVKLKLDPEHPQSLTAAQRKRLQASADKPDTDIDYSDIATMSAEFWAKHRPARVEPKAQVTLRIDQDVLDYFKEGGKGYQTRINEVLRSFVAAHLPGRR